MKILTIGTFDLLHAGHRHLIARAAMQGDLVVGVNSDRFVAEYKGDPAESEDERMMKVAALPGVVEVRLNDGPGRDLIEQVKPDLIVIGSDWVDRDYLAQIDMTREEIEQLDCDLLFVARIPGFSTTALRRQSVTAVVVTHANPAGARAMLETLAAQTRPPDEIILVATETSSDDIAALADDFAGFQLSQIGETGDWGHAKRARGLALASCDWVGWFNDDDAYADDYLEKMLVAADGVDVVYCEWNENPGCDFRIFQSTAGNFIVRRELAQKVGWDGREYEADGHFIEALKAAGARVVKVDERLYTHNPVEVAA